MQALWKGLNGHIPWHRSQLECHNVEAPDALVLSHLQRSTVLLLHNDGAELVVGEGAFVYGFAISQKTGYSLSWIAKVQGNVLAICELSNNSLVIALTSQPGADIQIEIIQPRFNAKQGCKVSILCPRRLKTCLKGTLASLAALRSTNVILAIKNDGMCPSSSILKIDTSSGKVLWCKHLDTDSTTLKTDPDGDSLTIEDKGSATTVTVSAPSLEANPLGPIQSQGQEQDRVPLGPLKAPKCKCGGVRKSESCSTQSHQHVCCSCPGKGNGTPNGGTPGNTNNNGGGSGSEQNGSGQTSDNHPIATVPVGGGATVSSDGDGGITLNPGNLSGGGICTIFLCWITCYLQLAGNFVVAQDLSLRNVAVISMDPFAVVQEYRFPSPGIRITSDLRFPKFVAFTLDPNIRLIPLQTESSHANVHQDVRESLRAFRSLNNPVPVTRVELFNLANLFDRKILNGGGIFLKPPNPPDGGGGSTTFDGDKPKTPHKPRPGVLGPLDVLVLPVIEPGQNSDGKFETAKVGPYLKRTFADVNNYYNEVTFGAWKGFNFHFFGYDFASDLGNLVIELPKNIKDYFWGDFIPANLVFTQPKVLITDVIRFNGNQSMTFKVSPSKDPSLGVSIAPFNVTLEYPAVVWSRDGTKLDSITINLDPSFNLALNVTNELKMNHFASASTSLNVTFETKAFPISNAADPKLNDFVDYLDGRIKGAEKTAGIPVDDPFTPKRLFSKPVADVVRHSGDRFGTLCVTLSILPEFSDVFLMNAVTTGLGASKDNFGLEAPMVGFFSVSFGLKANDMANYLNAMKNIADANAGQEGLSDIAPPSLPAISGPLTTTYTIGSGFAAAGATLTLQSSVNMQTLFSGTPTANANSDTTTDNANALRYTTNQKPGVKFGAKDGDDASNSGMLSDAIWKAASLIGDVGRSPTAETTKTVLNRRWDVVVVLAIPVPRLIDPANPDPLGVRPDEAWPLANNFQRLINDFRGQELPANINVSTDGVDGHNYTMDSKFTIDFFGQPPAPGDSPVPALNRLDTPLVCHEFGHALGFEDLYYQTRFRNTNAYFDNWAIMNNHWFQPHHNAEFKRQLGWIPEETDRFASVSQVADKAAGTVLTEFLLAPIERWDPGFPALIRPKFPGTDPNKVKVVQMIQLDLDGDGNTYCVVEARQPPDNVNQNYPLLAPLHPRGMGPLTASVLVSNCISLSVSDRVFDETEGRYRRRCQLMNPNNILTKTGDVFDLSTAPDYPVSGTKVTILDVQTVAGTPKGDFQVFHVEVAREYAPFLDLFFSSADPEWKNPDIYVDWIGDDAGPDRTQVRKYDPGTPLDQGEKVRIPPAGSTRPEPHWMVARVWNKGNVGADNIVLDYYLSDQGGGDGHPRDDNAAFVKIGNATQPLTLPPGTTAPGSTTITPVFDYAVHKWDVDTSIRSKGHYCIYVAINNANPGNNADGVRGSYDPNPINNYGQKNVWDFEVLSSSPYPDTEFDYTVKNNGPWPETAYLMAENLPHGVTLTIRPLTQIVPAKSSAVFHCTLSFLTEIIDATPAVKGCHVDPTFSLTTFRKTDHSAERWNGVEITARPRKMTTHKFTYAAWDYSPKISLRGQVTPNPGGGKVEIRFAYTDTDGPLFWVTVALDTNGEWSWKDFPVGGMDGVGVSALYEGNMVYGSSGTDELALKRESLK